MPETPSSFRSEVLANIAADSIVEAIAVAPDETQIVGDVNESLRERGSKYLLTPLPDLEVPKDISALEASSQAKALIKEVKSIPQTEDSADETAEEFSPGEDYDRLLKNMLLKRVLVPAIRSDIYSTATLTRYEHRRTDFARGIAQLVIRRKAPRKSL